MKPLRQYKKFADQYLPVISNCPFILSFNQIPIVTHTVLSLRGFQRQNELIIKYDSKVPSQHQHHVELEDMQNYVAALYALYNDKLSSSSSMPSNY